MGAAGAVARLLRWRRWSRVPRRGKRRAKRSCLTASTRRDEHCVQVMVAVIQWEGLAAPQIHGEILSEIMQTLGL